MSSKFNKIIQLFRDILLFIFSVLIMATSYGKWVQEPAHKLLFGIAASFLFLTLINLILLIVKFKGRWYFYLNSILQIFPLSVLLFMLNPMVGGIVGLILLILNLVIIFSLKK